MTLSRRLIVAVATSVGVAIVGVALAMGFLARDALIAQAENQARLVAGLIASEANRAELTADEIDRMIVSQMEAQALAIGPIASTPAAPGRRTGAPSGGIWRRSRRTARSTTYGCWMRPARRWYVSSKA